MNTIKRRSKDSTVTMSRENVFPNRSANKKSLKNRNFLGWPEYMLIPKGTPEGFPCQLFVMVTETLNESVLFYIFCKVALLGGDTSLNLKLF